MDKKIWYFIIISAILVLTFSVVKNKGNISSSTISAEDAENLHEVVLSIEGMYCQACEYGVKAQIEDLEGVASANISLAEGSGVVLYDADKVSPEAIAAASTTYPANVVSDKAINY